MATDEGNADQKQIPEGDDEFVHYKVRGKPEERKLEPKPTRQKHKKIVRALANQVGLSARVVGDKIEEAKQEMGIKGSQHGKLKGTSIDYGDEQVHVDD